MADVVKEEVLVSLRKVSQIQLDEICTSLNVIVADGKKTKKNAVMNAIQRYLSSEEVEDSDDEGLQVFQGLNEQLKTMLGTRQQKLRRRCSNKLPRILQLLSRLRFLKSRRLT